MNKIRILIIEDQPNDYKIVVKNFIKNTFLDKVCLFEQIQVLFKSNEHDGLLSVETFVEALDTSVDFIFLDLNFDTENIINDHDRVVGHVLGVVEKYSLDCKVVVLSKDGANSPNQNGPYCNGKYILPTINKTANQSYISHFIRRVFEDWFHTFLFKLSHNQMTNLRTIIVDNMDQDFIFHERSLPIPIVFAHLPMETKAYYDATFEIPDFEFYGWERFDNKMNYQLPVKEYFKGILTNPNWAEEVLRWNKKLEQLIEAHVITANISTDGKLEEPQNRLYRSIKENTELVWSTAKLGVFFNNDVARQFIQRVMVRRFILFRYLISEESPQAIYKDLSGKKENPQEKAIGNGFRYTYFIFDSSESEDIDKRKPTYQKLRKQLTFDDKKLFRHIGESIDKIFAKYGITSPPEYSRKLLDDCIQT